MRFPVIIVILAGALLLAMPAIGEEFTPPPSGQVIQGPCLRLQQDYPLAYLTLSSIHQEIEEIRQATAEKVEGYLADLAGATSEEQAEGLVRQIQRAELDQSICILKVQIKHARRAGQFDLVRTLQKQVLAALESDIQLAGLGRAD